MGEHKEGSGVGRRSAIKKIGAASAGLLLLGREVKTFVEGLVSTSCGDFYPLYERHDVGVEASRIPKGLDAFFREGTLTAESFNYRAIDLINNKTTDLITGVEYGPRSVEFSTIKVLAGNKTKVVYGDLLPVGDFSKFLEDEVQKKQTRMKAGAVTGMMYLALDQLMNKMTHKKPAEEVLKRRSFIGQKILLPAALALGTPFMQYIVNSYRFMLFANIDQKNAAQRVFQRIDTLLSATQPEEHIVFFRSVLMADKLMTLAENIQQATGRKARVAFNVGAGHAIMEDLLAAGHDFNRLILACYPKDFLKTAVQTAGGLENFAGVRVFTLNPDVTKEDVDTGNDSKVVIREDRLADQPLIKMLQSRLAA